MRTTGGWFRHARIRRVAIIVVSLLAVTGLAVAGTGRASAQGGLSATWTSWLNDGIENYGDTQGGWTSGDNPVQVPLGGGQDLWMFNDSFSGTVGFNGGANPFSVHYVHNMDLLTSGSGSSFTVNSTIAGTYSNGVQSPLISAPTPPDPKAQEWAWPAGGFVSDGNVEAIYNFFYYADGATGLNYAPVGNEVVTMPVSTITNPSTYRTTTLPSSSEEANCNNTEPVGSLTGCIQWGVSTLNSTNCPAGTYSSCTYIYGEVWPTAGDNNHTLVEAVAKQGDLAGTTYPWYYDNASGWSTTPGSFAQPLGSANVNAVSVYEISANNYIAVEGTNGYLGSLPGVQAYYSTSPQLTNASPHVELFTEPTGTGQPGEFGYQFHILPDYSSGSSVVMGFSVNSNGAQDQACLQYSPYVDIANYQPEFFSFTMPTSYAAAVAAGMGTLTAQPVSFTEPAVTGEQTGCLTKVPTPSAFEANYGGSGDINLSWTDTGGLYQYNVRREDDDSTSPTWTQFEYAVWDSPCSGNTEFNCVTDDANYADLIPGHTYIYELETDNWNGGSTGWDLGAAVTLPAKIAGTSSKFCASVAYGSTQNGAGLDQESCVGGYSSQEWQYTPALPDPNANYEEYQIGSLNTTNYCMEPVSAGVGAAIEQATCTTDPLDLWEFRVTDSNYDLQLYNPGSGLCLGSSGGSQSAGAWLVLATCSTASTATWDSALDY